MERSSSPLRRSYDGHSYIFIPERPVPFDDRPSQTIGPNPILESPAQTSQPATAHLHNVQPSVASVSPHFPGHSATIGSVGWRLSPVFLRAACTQKQSNLSDKALYGDENVDGFSVPRRPFSTLSLRGDGKADSVGNARWPQAFSSSTVKEERADGPRTAAQPVSPGDLFGVCARPLSLPRVSLASHTAGVESEVDVKVRTYALSHC
jgi:hypothetical protein